MFLIKSREELPLAISPSLLHLGYKYVRNQKKSNNKDYDKQCNTYSSVKETKLENDDGIGPLKPVPRILLQ